MTEDERWALLIQLDDRLLNGGVILSEWCSYIVKEADTAFAKGAYLASILTAVAGIETYLRSEYSSGKGQKFYSLIENSPIDAKLKEDLHELRKYRNKWVHVEDPWDDTRVLTQPENYEHVVEEMAIFSAKLLRRTIYENPWV